MYFGENRHSLSRKPDPEKDRLAEQNALLKKLLVQQSKNAEKPIAHRMRSPLSFLRPESSPGPETTRQHPLRQTAATKSRRNTVVLWSGIALLVVLLAGGGYIFMNRSSGTLPAGITKGAGFTVYYPSPMIPGYRLKKGSAKLNGGSAFYSLQNDSNVVTISEQAVPASPPDLNHLTGFTTFSTLAGNAAIGKAVGRSVALLLTNTTLVTIQGSPSTSQATVGNITRAMNPLQQ